MANGKPCAAEAVLSRMLYVLSEYNTDDVLRPQPGFMGLGIEVVKMGVAFIIIQLLLRVLRSN